MSFGIYLEATADPFLGLPRYNESEPTRPGLYLGLMHGRHYPTEELSDWGFNGPLIGPLKYVHTTYATHVRFEFVDPADERRLAHRFGVEHFDELTIPDDTLLCAGKYFGDWCVFHVA